MKTYAYDVFGAVRSTGIDQADTDFRFTGEREDPDVSGLYYLRARYYDPALGRFWTQDPWGGSAASPQTLNPYPYVGSNPANLVDPYGLCGFLDPVDCVQDAAECVANAGDCVREPIADAAIAVAEDIEPWLADAFEKYLLPGECLKLGLATVSLGTMTLFFATSPVLLAGTGVGAPVAILAAAELEVAAAASFGATAGVGYAAYKICSHHDDPKE